ncbi:Cullin repeat containing protein [Gracilaria domingensis]|nr:Cullin repeat containing protein [Gracilaria domingensis]
MLRGVRNRLRSRRRRRVPYEAALHEDRQPRVFRNISIDLLQKPFHLFPRRKSKEDETPLPVPLPPAPLKRNDDSFSSLPSTHASRDPFLNDDVPVALSPSENDDRPRKEDESTKSNIDITSQPASYSSASTLRKRSSLWKRSYDPDADFQSIHERDILRAVSLSEAAVKNEDVRAAQQLAHIVNTQIGELTNVLQEVQNEVQDAMKFAETLPFARHARFQGLLDNKTDNDIDKDGDRCLAEMQLTERLWDLEGFMTEKRYEDCALAIGQLKESSSRMTPRSRTKLLYLRHQLVTELASLCSTAPQAAETYGLLLKTLDAGHQARGVVLEDMRRDLFAELRHAATHSHDAAPRYLNVILNKTLCLFRRAHKIYTAMSFADDHNSSAFLLWILEQSDKVYDEFVRSVVAKACKADPITILSVIEAAQERREPTDQPLKASESSLLSVFQSRMSSMLRKDLHGPMQEAERQLWERAKTLACAIPASWKEGPYQSGTAMCDELSMISRSLGGILNIESNKEAVVGRMLVRPAVTYCATLVDMCAKSVKEEANLSMHDVQAGLIETMNMIGKALLRMRPREVRVEVVERAARALRSRDVGAVNTLSRELKRANSERVASDGRWAGGRGDGARRESAGREGGRAAPRARAVEGGEDELGDADEDERALQLRAKLFLAQQRGRAGR